jgi:hypothetical protein
MLILIFSSCNLNEILQYPEDNKAFFLLFCDCNSFRYTYPSEGEIVTVPDSPLFPNPGYTLISWNTSEDGTGVSYVIGSSFKMSSEPITLYAIWEEIPKEYTVSYVAASASGGSVPMDNSIYFTNDEIVVMGNVGALYRTDCVFTGWNTRPDGTGTSYKEGDAIIVSDSSVSLYAEWTIIFPSSFAGGSGTITDPFQISTAGQLFLIKNFLDSNFIQTADLDMAPYCEKKLWVSIGQYLGDSYYQYMFQGNYNGQGYDIANFATENLALFTILAPSSIVKNINFKSVNITHAQNIGTITGKNFGLIDNCSVSGFITGQGSIGGIACENNGKISNCSSSMGIKGGSYNYDAVGGIAGESNPNRRGIGNAGIITDSNFSGEIEAKGYSGGIVGHSYYGTITKCGVDGQIGGSGYSNIGGIIGYSFYSQVKNNIFTGILTHSSGYCTGGIIGSASYSTVSQCSSSGIIEGAENSGGIIGESNYSTTLNQSYSTGNVTGTNSVGGLIGYYASSEISDCYNSASVHGNKYIGGLVGKSTYPSIYCSYSTGSISGNAYIGGLVGLFADDRYIADSYYNCDIVNLDNFAGIPKSSPELKLKDTFIHWDFENIWAINERFDYPTLR